MSSPVTREEMRDLLEAHLGGVAAQLTTMQGDVTGIRATLEDHVGQLAVHASELGQVKVSLEAGAKRMRGMVHRRDVALVFLVLSTVAGAVYGGILLVEHVKTLVGK